MNWLPGPFVARITLSRAVLKYWLPTRAQETQEYCKSCGCCQIVGPKLAKNVPHTLMVLQPIEMYASGYIGRIPQSQIGTTSTFEHTCSFLSNYLPLDIPVLCLLSLSSRPEWLLDSPELKGEEHVGSSHVFSTLRRGPL